MMSCMVCDKHHDFSKVTGEPVLETATMVLSHFPVLNGEPATKGHLLLEARRHVVDPSELSDDEARDLGCLTRDGIKKLTQILGAEHVYIFRINDKVAHFHSHLVPRFSGTPQEFWGHKITEWKGAEKLDLKGVKRVAEKLRGG